MRSGFEACKTMSNSKKSRKDSKRRDPRGIANARVVRADIRREIAYITQLAQAEDARIVALGTLVLFSTRTRDAWMLDAEDNFALCLCRDGEAQPFHVIDTPTQFGIEWPAHFAIDGEVFVVYENSGRVVAIHGYPIAAIVAACRR